VERLSDFCDLKTRAMIGYDCQKTEKCSMCSRKQLNLASWRTKSDRPFLDDFRSFLPSQAASWARAGIKSLLLALSSFLLYHKPSWGLPKIIPPAHDVRPPFQNLFFSRIWLRRSPRFPHPDFHSKIYIFHIIRSCDSQNISQDSNGCVVWRWNEMKGTSCHVC